MNDDLLSDQPAEITLDDMIRCVRRELGQRARVYPRLVYGGKMTAGAAEREQAVMGAVLDVLSKLEKLP